MDQAELNQKKFALEEQKLRFDREFKESSQRSSNKWKFWTIIIPIMTALGTIGFGLYSLGETSRLQVQSAITEAILNGDDTAEAIARARIAAVVSPNLVSGDMVQRIEGLKNERHAALSEMSSKSKGAILELLAAHPKERKQIIEDWTALFPEDRNWAQTLSASTGIQSVKTRKPK